jgi:hypothetical protein
MADSRIIPGTNLSVIDKYAKSLRLDHPDFGDVLKTTFAKGIITEFQGAGRNIQSMVKVEVEGDESDFIPLFYHPKEKYWDDEAGGGLAQDFDDTKGCFKKGWMSFQSGDEVAVMMQEGVPVAVVGFADGVPRIGENAVKMSWQKWNGEPHFVYFKAAVLKESYGSGSGGSALGSIDSDPPGPDGAEDLGLLTEAFKLCETAEDSHVFEAPASLGNPWITQTSYYKYHEYLIRLGGKAIIFQIGSSRHYVEGFKASFPDGPVKSDEPWGDPYPFWLYSPPEWSFLGATDKRDLIESTKDLGETHSGYSAYSIHNGDYNGGNHHIFVPYSGFSFQQVLCDAFGWSPFYGTGPNAFDPGSWSGMNVTKGSSVKIYIRPHTKTELQDAGMWPA